MQVKQPKPTQPAITEIIERLQAHLDRFEADKAIRKQLKLNWPIVCRGPADHWVGFAYSCRGRSCKFIKPEKAPRLPRMAGRGKHRDAPRLRREP